MKGYQITQQIAAHSPAQNSDATHFKISQVFSQIKWLLDLKLGCQRVLFSMQDLQHMAKLFGFGNLKYFQLNIEHNLQNLNPL